jgi:hypothetical protein
VSLICFTFAGLFIYASHQQQRTSIWRIGIPVLAMTVIVVLIIGLGGAVIGRLYEDDVMVGTTALVIWFALAIVSLGFITYWGLSSAVKLVEVLSPVKDWRRYSMNWFRWLLLLSAAIVLQWLIYQLEQHRIWSLLIDMLGKPSGGNAFWLYDFVFTIMLYPINFLHRFIDLLPYIILAGLLGILYSVGQGSFWNLHNRWQIRIAALLFAGYVIGDSGVYFQMNIPIAFLVGLMLLAVILNHQRKRMSSIVVQVARMNTDPGADQRGLLIDHRRELLQRAKAIENLARQQSALNDDYMSGKVDDATYYAKQTQLEEETNRLTTGSVSVEKEVADISWGPTSSWHSRMIAKLTNRAQVSQGGKLSASLRVPPGVSPRRLALTLGPMDTLWDNGILAAKIGGVIGLIPIGYFFYILITQQAREQLGSYFGVLSIVFNVASEVAFWLVAAFIMGYLYLYLPGRNGVFKGTFLAIIYWIAEMSNVLVSLWLTQSYSTTWTFRALQLSLFLVALGVAIDWYTLKRQNIYWRNLLDYYKLNDVRVLIGYASPLVLAVLAIGQQLLSGQAQQAVTELIKTLPQAIPLFGK